MLLRRGCANDRPIIENQVLNAIRNKPGFGLIYRNMLLYGLTKDIPSVGHPAINELGDIVHFIVTVMDHTEHTVVHDDIRKSLGQLFTESRYESIISSIICSPSVNKSPETLKNGV